MQPSDAELRETIARMEERLRTHSLFSTYERLAERFAAELPDERDVLLSRGAALMLLQELAAGERDLP